MTRTSMNQPIETLRDGAVKVAIWKNQGENGAFHSAEPFRTIKTDSGYKDVHGFSGANILRAKRLLDKAYERIEILDAVEANPAIGS